VQTPIKAIKNLSPEEIEYLDEINIIHNSIIIRVTSLIHKYVLFIISSPKIFKRIDCQYAKYMRAILSQALSLLPNEQKAKLRE
jgi:hypothetical protein